MLPHTNTKLKFKLDGKAYHSETMSLLIGIILHNAYSLCSFGDRQYFYANALKLFLNAFLI